MPSWYKNSLPPPPVKAMASPSPFPLPLDFLRLLLLAGTAFFCNQFQSSQADNGGSWKLLQRSIGVSAMHMQLLSNDRVIIFDRTDFGPSNLSLPAGNCREDPSDRVLKTDCTAHSVEYDVSANSFRPLTVLTDTWCSSGSVAPDGRLFQTGGFNDGERAVRSISPCGDGCDWTETPAALSVRRWYATNQILPGGAAIIIGGRRQFNYEFYPKRSRADGLYSLPFLVQTRDPEENNLYPFVHLNVDGNLFIFANNRAILLDYRKNAVVRTYPAMPGGDPRNYPSTGSSVLLPLKNLEQKPEAEVLVCGGAPAGSYDKATQHIFVKALNTCGRMKITAAAPAWEMETMPTARSMGDMVLLPTGDVLIVNGVSAGTAAWERGRDPVLAPVVYRPGNPRAARFELQNPSTIPRVYHSTAILLRDGRVLVGGSNPNAYYNFTGVLFPTELSLEAFSPSYLDSGVSSLRPKIVPQPSGPMNLSYGGKFTVQFQASRLSSAGGISVTMAAPPFTTHSFSMNQRLIFLATTKGAAPVAGSTNLYRVEVAAPGSAVFAPSGYYLVFVVNGGIPSEGIWVQIL